MDYPKLPGLTPDGRVYWNEEMGTIEARIPNGGYRSGHGPALLELPNGDLLCGSIRSSRIKSYRPIRPMRIPSGPLAAMSVSKSLTVR